jgi:hypothetical protein
VKVKSGTRKRLCVCAHTRLHMTHILLHVVHTHLLASRRMTEEGSTCTPWAHTSCIMYTSVTHLTADKPTLHNI